MITVKPFFDKDTSTFSYVVYDEDTKDAVIIDPVLDFEPLSATVSFWSLGRLCDFVTDMGLKVQLVADTHAHADHMSGAHFLKKRLSVPSAIGEGFFKTRDYFANFYDIDPQSYEPAYDLLLSHHQTLSVGSLTIKTLLTPGHTPTCAAYLIDDALFSGDAIFQEALGCGRTDFPGGSAQTLYRSITEQIFSLPDSVRIFVGHDYPKENGEPRADTSVLAAKKNNVIINETVTESQFVRKRQTRDLTLPLPRLLLLAMQVNILGGQLPKLGPRHALTIPLTVSKS